MPTVLVTGANRGIGLELCKRLAARGDEVIAVCRASNAALEVLGVRVEAGGDVTSDAALAALSQRLRGVQIDWVIANAGILRADTLDALSFETVQEQLEVNAIGPLRSVKHLLPHLTRGGKIGLITSRMGSIADNSSGGYYGYRMSKAALNAAGASLAIDLKPRGIAVAILHPGFVRTDMTGHLGNVDAADCAGLLVERMQQVSLETTGSFWHANGERLPW